MKEAGFYVKMPQKKVKCYLCARRCLISDGNLGFCRVRKNLNGKLFSLIYGKVAAMHFDPIEKKPLYHFAPGTTAFSWSTVGCTFRCKFCCNSDISMEWKNFGKDMTPNQIVSAAKGAQGIAYTYVEPTIFAEFAIDTAKVSKGFYNVFVTDGYATPESAKAISKHIDAAVVDFKASANPESYKSLSLVPDVNPIFDCIKEYHKNKVHLEISNLLMQGHGDSPEQIKKLCRWISENLGPDTPLHLIRFLPSYKMMDVPSAPVELLQKAYNIAKSEGLNYVYLGNVPGESNTYCPKCGELVIQRGQTVKILLKKGKCSCGHKIPILGLKWSRQSNKSS